MAEEVMGSTLEQPAAAPKRRSKRRLKPALIVLIVIFAVAGSGWLYANRQINPVPKTIQRAVDFPVYYPAQKKLPAGYTLDLSSFKNPQKNGVTYQVDYGLAKKLVFSIQPKPSDSELQTFEANYIPLRIDFQTPSGKAEIGAYNNHGVLQTLVSLPTNSKTWVIVTGPYDVNQGQLKQVLSAIRK